MPLFSYTATTAGGERTRGVVDAMSLQAARSALQETGLFVEEIHEALPSEQESVKPWETAAVAEQSYQLSAVRCQEMTDGSQGSDGVSLGDVELKEAENLKPGSYNLKASPSYYPFLDTLRLYAGWLLAWYVLVIALGAYQETKELPFSIPLVEGLWQSPLLIRAVFGVFLFLLCTSLHRFFGSRKWVGGVLCLAGVFLFYVFLVNT